MIAFLAKGERGMARFEDDMISGLKAGMRRLVASVCVISLKDSSGQRHCMTATAVSSLSDDPPALLVCVNKGATAYPALMDGVDFCVSIFDEQHEDLSALCAGMTDEENRFARGNWLEHEGLPYLQDAQASFFCCNEQVVPYGSHIIAIGKLKAVFTADGEVRPLLYADGQYHKLS